LDSMVPVMHSARLFECCASRRKLLVTPSQMEHNSNLFDSPEFLSVPTLRFFRFLCVRGRPVRRMPTELFLRPTSGEAFAKATSCDGSLSPRMQEEDAATEGRRLRGLRQSQRTDGIDCNFFRGKCQEGVQSCAVKTKPMKSINASAAEQAAMRRASPWSCCTRPERRSELPHFELGLPEEDWSMPPPEEFEGDGAEQPTNLCSSMRRIDTRNEGLCTVLATPFDGRPPPDRDVALDVGDNEIGISTVKHWDELFGDPLASHAGHAKAAPLASSDPFCGRASRVAA